MATNTLVIVFNIYFRSIHFPFFLVDVVFIPRPAHKKLKVVDIQSTNIEVAYYFVGIFWIFFYVFSPVSKKTNDFSHGYSVGAFK